MKKNPTMEELLSALTETMSAQDILAADIISSLSNAIAKRRIAMGLSQKELADQIGKSQSTISKWENGDLNFSIETLAEIAVKLELDLTVKLAAREPVQISSGYRSTRSKVVDFEKINSKSYNASDEFALKQM